MNRNQIAVLRFLLENANSRNVLDAIEGVASGKYSAADTSLLKRVKPGDLLCYAAVRVIAGKTNLKPGCARDQVKKLRNAGFIETEQLWELFFDETAERIHRPADELHPKPYILTIGGKIDLISEDEGMGRRWCGDFEDVRPGANLYRILKPQIPPAQEPHYVNSGEQLSLPFPPAESRERTILAPSARLWDPFFAPAGERR